MPPDVNSVNCPLCKGAQWLYAAEGEVLVPSRCRCLERKLLHEFLGTEIANAKKIESPLYLPRANEANEIEGDRTEENLFLKGPWALVCRHLRWVLSGKRRFSQGFTYKIITNEKVLSVWLGHESYTHRPTTTRNEDEIHNRLNDLMEDPTLVILRLDALQHQNKAAANVLKEALKVREFVYKPLWLVECDQYFGSGHPSYNEEVGDYIAERFCIVDLNDGSEVPTKASQAIAELRASVNDALETGEVAMGLGVEPSPPAPETETPSAEPIHSEERFFAEPGSSSSQGHKKYRPGGRGKRDGGGLPGL